MNFDINYFHHRPQFGLEAQKILVKAENDIATLAPEFGYIVVSRPCPKYLNSESCLEPFYFQRVAK